MGRKGVIKRQAEVVAAVAKCKSMAGVMRELGLRVAGANYHTIRWAIRKLGLDTSHFTGQGHRKGSKIPIVAAQPLEHFLKRDSFHCTSGLRLRLLKEGVFEPRCAACNLESWQGQAIPLELDHKDGDRFNNLIDNLRLLCPNCHALTPTYRGKNQARRSGRPGGGIGFTQGS
jgi:hypothetical protein